MPSKYSKSLKHGKKREGNTRFSLYQEDEFNWWDFKFTLGASALFAIIHFVSFFLHPTNVFLELSPEMVSMFAFNPQLILTNVFEWYRFITSLFIHGNIIHLAGNLLFFVIFSIRLEELKGWPIALTVFLVAGIAGNLLTLVVLSGSPNFWTLGASGGINGLFAAVLVTMRKEYDKGTLSVFAFIVIFASFTIAGQNTNFFGHLGGLLGGGLFMYYLDEYIDKDF